MSTAREIVFARSCRAIEPDISDEASLGGGNKLTGQFGFSSWLHSHRRLSVLVENGNCLVCFY